MYASIGSYIARAIRLFDIRFERYPPAWAPWLLAVAAYLNFFTHHYLPDIRVALFAASAAMFAPTWVGFTADERARRMPRLNGMLAFDHPRARTWTMPTSRRSSPAWAR